MKLNEYQKKAILVKDGNVAVIAAAGSGKTCIMTYRIAKLVKDNVNAENILAVTFSRAAADNMSKKIKGVLNSDVIPTINTFHGLGLSILKEHDPMFKNNNSYLINDYWVDTELCDICIKDLQLFNFNEEVPVGFIKSYMSYQKMNLNAYDDELEYVDNIPNGLCELSLRQIYKKYEVRKQENKKIDFSDMVFKAYKLLLNNENIRKYYQNKWKYVLVDEAQDCNMLQFEFIKLINTENVMIVGDVRQAIYGFSGARPEYILDFKKHFKNARYINLPINYRCSKNIVDLSNTLIGYSEESNHESYEDAIANNSEYKNPKLSFYRSPAEEIEEISKKIKEMVDNGTYNYKDFAILMRANAQSGVIQSKFCDENIPYEVIGRDSYFERKEIRDMINFLKVVHDDNEEAFYKIYNTPSRWLGRVFLKELKDYATTNNKSMVSSLGIYAKICKKGYKNGCYSLLNIIDSAKRMKNSPVGDIIKTIIEKSRYSEYILREYNDESRLENLSNFISQANNYNDISLFLQKMQEILEHTEKIKMKKKTNDKDDSVKILTAHKSKGLEYPVVFCISMNEGLFPHHKGELGEERRLCYVAITRAEKELYLSTTQSSNGYPSQPSSFLYEMFGEDLYNINK